MKQREIGLLFADRAGNKYNILDIDWVTSNHYKPKIKYKVERVFSPEGKENTIRWVSGDVLEECIVDES